MNFRFPRASAWLATALAGAVGLGLLIDAARSNSATYDEPLYLKTAAHWRRTGDDLEIVRVGSPLLFWKLQQAPTLWLFDRFGRREWVDEPIAHPADSLPLLRIGALWIWLVAWGTTTAWARRAWGRRAMVFAAWWFALSPNLIAHGSLLTMETPLIACAAVVFWTFREFLTQGRRRWFWVSAAFCGLAFSCKFTAIVFPPMLGAIWLGADLRRRSWKRAAAEVGLGLIVFFATMLVANWFWTGFATAPASPNREAHQSLGRTLPAGWRKAAARALETPIPRDWAGFAAQLRLQARGGTSYLFGERRQKGWSYYYFVALAVKTPLSLWIILSLRAFRSRRARRTEASDRRNAVEDALPAAAFVFLAIAAAGSSRNYGLRYLLPLAPLTIVWGSAVVERGVWRRRFAWLALAGQAIALGASHPHELTFFNRLAGGPQGGRRILADSNLDWGQGCRALALRQRENPDLRDLTFYYFGDVDPASYGVIGKSYPIRADSWPRDLPKTFSPTTRYVAVSASLRFGPWGPPGYFRELDGRTPVEEVAGWAIEIFRNDRTAKRGQGD